MKISIWAYGLVFFVLALTGTNAQVTNFSGSLTNVPYVYNRPHDTVTFSGTAAVYRVFQFTNASSATISARVTPTNYYLYIYQNLYNPRNPLQQLYSMGVGQVDAVNLFPGTHYLVVSGPSTNETADFSGAFTNGTVGIVTAFTTNLTILAHPTGGTVLTGNTVGVSAIANGRFPHTFQWYHGPKPEGTNAPVPALAIPGATNYIYNSPPIFSNVSYWCLITGNETIPPEVRSSEAHFISVTGPATFSGSLTPEHDTWDRMIQLGVPSGNICPYEIITFSVFFSGNYTIGLTSTGFPAAINLYAPYFDPSTPNLNFYADGVVDNEPGPLSLTTFLAAGQYSLIISSSNAGQYGTFGGTITGTSIPLIHPPQSNLVIVSQSSGATFLTNHNATLQFATWGAVPRRYQWFTGETYEASGMISGATNKTYTTPVFTTPGSRYFWARATNIYGEVKTGIMHVRVLSQVPVIQGNLRPGNRIWQRSNGSGGVVTNLTYYKIQAFQIQQQGVYNFKFGLGEFGSRIDLYSAFFDPEHPNLGLYHYGSGNATFSNSLPVGNYHLVISSGGLGNSSIYTGTITGPLIANLLDTPYFTTFPNPTSQVVWPNDRMTITVTQSVPVSYEWYPGEAPGVPVDGMSPLPGENSNTLYPPMIHSSRWYYARAYNQYGYDDGPLTHVHIRPPPTITIPPKSTNFLYRQPGVVSAQFSNIPFRIVWQTPPANDFATHLIQTTATVNYVNVSQSSIQLSNFNAGTYQFRCVVTNPSGAVTSDFVTVDIGKRPLTYSVFANSYVYDGEPHSVFSPTITDTNLPAIPLPSPLMVVTQYHDAFQTITGLPVNAGFYFGVVRVEEANYSGSSTGFLLISKRPLDVTVSNATRIYNGQPQSLPVHMEDPDDVVSVPPLTPVSNIFIDVVGNVYSNAPVTTGIWTQRTVIADPNFSGGGTGRLVIVPRTLTIQVPNDTNVYNAQPQSLGAIVQDENPPMPPPLPLVTQYFHNAILYTNAPINAGQWTQVVSSTDSNVTGSGTGILHILVRPLSIAISNQFHLYDGTPKALTNIVVFDPDPDPELPEPMPLDIRYDDGTHLIATPPFNTGVWTGLVTIIHSNYSGFADGILEIFRPDSRTIQLHPKDGGIVVRYIGVWDDLVNFELNDDLLTTNWTPFSTGHVVDQAEIVDVPDPDYQNYTQRHYRA
ncbi:MAG TPA: MBG domain-containing protein, partial [Kiritimatiellia bacterium]|nr:MBG domain-containing protein [Kiritimatiellia bacterium]